MFYFANGVPNSQSIQKSKNYFKQNDSISYQFYLVNLQETIFILFIIRHTFYLIKSTDSVDSIYLILVNYTSILWINTLIIVKLILTSIEVFSVYIRYLLPILIVHITNNNI